MTRSMIDCLVIAGLAVLLSFSTDVRAQRAEPRLALVIGNADYRSGALTTPANDAGLIAETLRAEGFEVSGAANLDQDSLRRAFRDFLGRAAQAGPDAIAFVYLSGRGLQYEGENYFAPVEAVIARDSDIPIEALRISDFTRALAALPLRARIVVIDAARANSFAKSGQPLAGGLALVEPEPGSLYAFNAGPGTIAPDEPGPYGAYAAALAEMLREGGAPIDEVFSRIRLRVNEVTRGAFVPWDVSNIQPPVVLLAGNPKAPPSVEGQNYAAFQSRPIQQFPVEEAYAAAIERDTIAGYQEFLAAYPDDRMARRVRALLAARREALSWRRAVEANAPNAYWSYMRRYPRGPHFWDARRRLAILSAPFEPPPRFDVYDFGGLPPPPPVEYEIIDRPVIMFDLGDYPPPPPPPVYFLPPRPVEFIELAPPPPPQGPGFLPIPIPIPLPFAQPGAPQGVVIQQNFGQQGPIGPGGGGPGAGDRELTSQAVQPRRRPRNRALRRQGQRRL
ncbi:caspase family protein [Methylocapsa polymorpha]|uniref:Caspase family protein n=1 Tax=Methylocapsa polymorpha TaxID=3080828 RepID=A0ABZ0HVB8_9HYPH|nr:caspase family protein [Methylocapsa sp. RX1]